MKRNIFILLFFFLSQIGLAQCPATADFTFQRNCTNGSFKFTNASTPTTPGAITNWYWDFGDGTTANVPNPPNHNYASPGIYDVQLIVTHSSTCKDTTVKQVIVNSLPVASFTFTPDGACSGSSIAFTNTSTGTGLTYSWNFGDGTTSNAESPSHIFTAYGCGTKSFEVTLTVTDADGCTSTATQQVSILEQPSVLFKEAKNFVICTQSILIFDKPAIVTNYSPSASCIASYTIDWGDGTSQTLTSFDTVSHIYTALGYYTVVFTAIGTNGCTTIFKDTAIVETNPAASIGQPIAGTNTGCAPLPISIVNKSENISSNTTFILNWGDGYSQTLNHTSVNDSIWHTYTKPNCSGGLYIGGGYEISLTATNICNTSTAKWSPVRVLEPARASFYVNDATVCLGTPITFTNNSRPNSCSDDERTRYIWDFGDGNIDTVFVNWNVSPQQRFNYTYANNGKYTVKLTAENLDGSIGCGPTMDSMVIIVSQTFPAFSADTVCFGQPTHFTNLTTTSGDGAVMNYHYWSFGDWHYSSWSGWWQSHSHAHSPIFTYDAPGTYNVCLDVNTNYDCPARICKNVIVKRLPDPSFTAPIVCVGDTTRFTNTSVAYDGATIVQSYWNFGGSNTSNEMNPTFVFPSAGSHNVTLKVVDSRGCERTRTFTVQVSGPPTANFTADIACVGSPTSFHTTATAHIGSISQWDWDFGDGSPHSTASNPSHTYPDTGTYYVKQIVVSSIGCIDSVTLPVYVSPYPIADFVADTVCAGTPTSFTDSSKTNGGSAVNRWRWNFGDSSSISTQQNPTHIYEKGGPYNVELTVYNENNCATTITKQIYVIHAPQAEFSFINVCDGNAIEFHDLSIADSATIATWHWDFGDTTTYIGKDTSHLYATHGIYSVQLIVSNDIACTDTITKEVKVYRNPIADFQANAACIGLPTSFQDLTDYDTTNITNYYWDFGDSTGATVRNPTHTYGTDTLLYDVTLIVLDAHGCRDTIRHPITLNPLPIADFTNDTLMCSGSPVSFNADSTVSPGGNISTWHWTFGDGSTPSTAQYPTHAYSTTSVNTYTITLLVTDVNGCTDTAMRQTKIIPLPVVNFTPTNACSGDSTHFNDLSSIAAGAGSLVSWTWNFGDGNASNEQSPNHLYDSVDVTTTHTVVLTVESSYGCIDSTTRYPRVYPLPIPSFTTDIVCMGGATSFNNSSTSAGGAITDWLWDFDDGGATSTEQNPEHYFSSHGLYQVSLTATDVNTCQNTIQQTVIVDSLPAPSFDWVAACHPGLIYFTNNSSGSGSAITSYSWNFGDGSSTVIEHPTHHYPNLGMYDVTLIVNNAKGCTDTIVVPVSVEPILEVDFTADTVCLGEQMHFNYNLISQNLPARTWFWSFGDGEYSTETNPTHLFTQTGTFNTFLRCTDSLGCDYTVIKEVIVNVNPVANFSYTRVQEGTPTVFTDSSYTSEGFITSWHWDFGDGYTSTEQNPSHIYASAGTYMATLIVFNNFGCSDTITIPIIVDESVNADFAADTVCSNTPTTFTDLSYTGAGAIISWHWDFGDGGTSTEQSPQHYYINDGTYAVTLIVTADNGVSDTITKQVVVLESPVAYFTYTEVCLGNPTELFDNSTGATYPVSAWQWDLGDGNTSSQYIVQHNYDTSGQWQVQLIVTNTIGCTDTIVQPVNVWEIPQVNFEAVPREGCRPLSVQFNDYTAVSDGVISSWIWDFGDGYTSVSPGVATHIYPYHGSFNVGLTVVSNHGCTGNLTIPNMVQVYPTPMASFFYLPKEPTILDGVVFTDVSFGANQWFWDFGDNSVSNNQSPIHYYANPGNYNVIQIVLNEHDFADTTSTVIRVNPGEVIWAPNAISVNNDGINDVFNVFGIGWSSDNFELRIFNRWGEEIYHTTDINKGWDGTDENTGNKVPIGVYVWKVKIMNYSNETFKYIGSVTVIE